MGREIRRVPANWEHPRIECTHSPWGGGYSDAKANGGKCYQPMYDNDFQSEMDEWIKEYILWKEGGHPECKDIFDFCDDYNNPPRPEYYHPKFDNPVWYQVYETVSEGTPVTPPFETKQELVDYLIKYGDFSDQWHDRGGWERKAAEQFVDHEWAPSAWIFATKDKVIFHAPRDGDIEGHNGI
jgi:hypothetical protein